VILGVVIAGLDPAIHAAGWLAEIATLLTRCKSAWTTGSSPVVTIERERAACSSLRAQRSNPVGLRGKLDCFVASLLAMTDISSAPAQ
jgi:hypothetical protein